MDVEELKNGVKECIKELSSRFWNDKNRDGNGNDYGLEADFHFDLYFLLNKNIPALWENKSVIANTHKGFDLVINDPKDGDSKIAMEIKCGSWRAKRKNSKKFWKYIKEEKINGLTYDFLKLISSKEKLAKMFLYFGRGDSEDLRCVKKVLKDNLSISSEVECMIIHSASPNKILENKDIKDIN